LIAQMDRRGYDSCVPVNADESMPTRPFLDFSAGYVQRAVDRFPRQGTSGPWRIRMSYAQDLQMLRGGEVDDGVLVFSRSRERVGQLA